MPRKAQAPMTKMSGGEEFLNASAAEKRFKASKGYLRLLVSKGQIERHRFDDDGNQNYYSVSDLEKLLKEREDSGGGSDEFSYAADI